ncbi:MAG: hypothetical protein JXA41_10640 [Deltaproteobacteria bacterium]|nr:hypothetical protein [Deltaproteobacteria bacterium]
MHNALKKRHITRQKNGADSKKKPSLKNWEDKPGDPEEDKTYTDRDPYDF